MLRTAGDWGTGSCGWVFSEFNARPRGRFVGGRPQTSSWRVVFDGSSGRRGCWPVVGFCHAALGVGRFVVWCPETCPAPPLAPPSQGGNWCCAATQGWDAVPREETFRWWGMCAMESVEMGSGASTSQLTLGRSPGGAAGGLCAARGTGWGGWGRSGRTRRSALPRRWLWARWTMDFDCESSGRTNQSVLPTGWVQYPRWGSAARHRGVNHEVCT